MAQPRVLGAGKGDRPAGVCAERLGRAGQRGHHHPPPGPPVLEALQVGCSPCPVPLIQTPYPRDLLGRHSNHIPLMVGRRRPALWLH